jgi:hypothetical protein
MALISGNDKLCVEICGALGLKHVRALTIRMAVGEVVKVEVEYFPDSQEMQKLAPILLHYRLLEKK